MIGWFGVSERVELRGVVADRCPGCDGQVALFDVLDHFSSGHVYFIPTPDEHGGTSAVCRSCGVHLACEEQLYEGFLSPVEADGLSLDEVLARTNVRLARSISFRQELLTILQQAPSQGASDQDRRRAIERLGGLGDLDAEMLLVGERLLAWDKLDGLERQRLCDEISAIKGDHDRLQEAVEFGLSMAEKVPGANGSVILLVIATPILLGIPSFMWPFALKLPQLVSFGLGLASFGVVAFTPVWLASRASRTAKRRWLRETFVPEGKQRGVDFRLLLSILQGSQPHEELPYEKDLLLQVLREDGTVSAPS